MISIARVIARLELGGTQLGALRLTAALAERGISTRVLAGEASEECASLFREAGVELEVWGGGEGLQYACSEPFAAWLEPRLQRAELVHAHMFGGWWASARAIGPDSALVASEHNALRWPGAPRTRQMRAALERVDAFVAHGPAARAAVEQQGFPTARIVSGRSPIEPPAAPGAGRHLPRPRIVYAGRLHEEKGPDLLLEAIALLRRPPASFLLGSGPLEAALRTRVRLLGLERVVRMPGWQRAVAPWLDGAEMVVVPSRHEAWGQSAVTAMASGVPAIGTAVEGLPTTLGEGRGILVAPGDPPALARAIEQVLGGRRPRLADARAYSESFTADKVAAGYARLYRRAIALRAPVVPLARRALARDDRKAA